MTQAFIRARVSISFTMGKSFTSARALLIMIPTSSVGSLVCFGLKNRVSCRYSSSEEGALLWTLKNCSFKISLGLKKGETILCSFKPSQSMF